MVVKTGDIALLQVTCRKKSSSSHQHPLAGTPRTCVTTLGKRNIAESDVDYLNDIERPKFWIKDLKLVYTPSYGHIYSCFTTPSYGSRRVCGTIHCE